MKIAIIECDVPVPALEKRFGTYTKYFETLLCGSVDESTARTLDFVPFRAYLGERLPTTSDELAGYDGILFTGSKFNSYDNDEWILRTLELIKISYGRIKMVGICFGHQLIARALGGQVAPNPKGWEIAVTSTTTFSCEIVPALKDLRLQQMHRDIVTVPPPNALVVGSNDVCAVQALYEPHRYFSVQGHPEFNAETIETVVHDKVSRGIMDERVGAEAISRARLPHDGNVVAAAIVEFFKRPAA